MPTPSDPSAAPSKQFSSDKTGDPIELLNQATSSVEAHSNILNAYGYKMPMSTLGQTPWLRDSLADSGEDEPGTGDPVAGKKVPFGGCK